MKPKQDFIVSVNATNNESISVENPTKLQFDKLKIDNIRCIRLKLRWPRQYLIYNINIL